MSKFIGKLLFTAGFSLFIGGANSQSIELTTCKNPEGKAYRHNVGSNNITKSAGWDDEAIRNGVITLRQLPDGNFDVLYIDTRGKPMSAVQDGAKVILLRRGPSELALLVHYDGPTSEIYSFFNEADGKSKFSMLTNRIGPSALSAKSSLMVGPCDAIRFDRLR